MTEEFLVLVVDDDEAARTAVCEVLKAHGYPSLEATGGLQALQRLGDVTPGLILVDLEMPEMNGWELVAALQAQDDPALRRIPVVVMVPGDGAASSPIPGTAGHVRKPVATDVLLEVVRNARAAHLSAERERRRAWDEGNGG